jgi:Leucine Rich Repeat (LRR) protein
MLQDILLQIGCQRRTSGVACAIQAFFAVLVHALRQSEIDQNRPAIYCHRGPKLPEYTYIMRFPRPRTSLLPLPWLIVLSALSSCGGDGHVPVSTPFADLKFADPVLKNCVLKDASRHGWDTSGQMTRLGCTNPEGDKVRDLEGIQNLVNLQSLDLAHNAIVDVGLIDRLQRLNNLDLGYNQIVTVPFDRLRVTLRWLNLHENRIEDISWLASLRHIEHLSISHNQVRNIEAVTQLPDLRSLNFRDNQIDDISALASIKSLRELDLGTNKIKDISPLAPHTTLVNLVLSNNRIHDLQPLSNLAQLEELDLSNNQVTNVVPLANIITLRSVDLQNNQIKAIGPLESLGEIEYIAVEGNPLACKDVRELSQDLGINVFTTACDTAPAEDESN